MDYCVICQALFYTPLVVPPPTLLFFPTLYWKLQLCHSSKASMAQSSPSTPFIDIMDSGSIISGSVESTNIRLQAPDGGAWACVCACMDCDRQVTFHLMGSTPGPDEE